MNRSRWFDAGWLAALLLSGWPIEAMAQAGGSYNLTWNTFDGGGRTFSTGGVYVLGGSAGQPDAGVAAGGSYGLFGGFWNNGSAPVSGVVHIEAPPSLSRLYPSLPNPFASKTRIAFDLVERAAVQASVFNLNGGLVRRLADGFRPAGHHELTWDGRDDSGRMLPHGIYFLNLRAGVFNATQKMLFVR